MSDGFGDGIWARRATQQKNGQRWLATGRKRGSESVRVRKMFVFCVVLQAVGESAPRCVEMNGGGCCCWMTLFSSAQLFHTGAVCSSLALGKPKLLAFVSFRLPVSLHPTAF
jgi:hypothetical protein